MFFPPTAICRSLRIKLFLVVMLAPVTASHFPQAAKADVYLTGFFSGTIEQFDEHTKVQTTFASIPSNPGLSGLAYNPTNNRFYVSALNHGAIYVLDFDSHAIIGYHQLAYGPGGLTVDPKGNVVVTDFTSNQVRIYDPEFADEPIVISVPVPGVTSGVGYIQNGDLLIATAGTGVFRYDGTVSPFTLNPAAALASAQIAADSSNNIFIGHGLGFSDSVFKFDPDGNVTGTIEATEDMIGGTGAGSSQCSRF